MNGEPSVPKLSVPCSFPVKISASAEVTILAWGNMSNDQPYYFLLIGVVRCGSWGTPLITHLTDVKCTPVALFVYQPVIVKSL